MSAHPGKVPIGEYSPTIMIYFDRFQMSYELRTAMKGVSPGR